MLYREIIAVCSQIHTQHINTPCGQNVELLSVKPDGTNSDHRALKRRKHSCSHATGTHTAWRPATVHLDTDILGSLCPSSNTVMAPRHKTDPQCSPYSCLTESRYISPPSCIGNWITFPNYMIQNHFKIPQAPPQIVISINAGVGTK